MPSAKLAIIPVTPFQQNCAVLWDDATKRCIIVDPGGEAERIIEGVHGTGLRCEAILLTHGHLDHAGGAKAVKAALDAEYGAPVPLLGPDARDAFLLDEIETSAARFGASGMQNVRPDRFLEEGEVIEAAGFRFEILHCPGHSPGSIVYFERAMRFAFVGDVIFKNSIGRTDFPYGDHAALIDAINTKLLPLGDDIGFICGHGPGSKFGVERENNPYLQA